MKTGVFGGKWLIGGALLGALLASGNAARAEDEKGEKGEKTEEKAEPAAAEANVHASAETTGEAGEKAEKGEKGEVEAPDLDQLDETAPGEGEGTFYAFVDAVIGFGKEPIAIQNAPTSSTSLPTYGTGAVRTTSESFLLGLGFAATHNLNFNIKVPLAWGEFSPPDSAGISGRGALAVGNTEIEAEYHKPLNETVNYYGILGISLPTASGTAMPENVADLPGNQVDQGAYDRAAVLRAAALSRGQEVDALFETHRFGINPKLMFALKAGDKITITPALKMENLIGTTSDVPHKYLGELVPSVAASYDVSPSFQPVLKVWGNWAFAGSDESKKFGMAVEPQALLSFGAFHTGLGVIIPFVGPAADPNFIGIRLYAGSSF